MKLTPVFIPNVNADKFLASHAHPVVVGGVEFITAPLRTNCSIDLLGLSHHSELAVNGLIDHTDFLDSTISIAKAYLSIRGEVGIHVVEFDTTPDADQKHYAKKSIEGSQSNLTLQLTTTGNVLVGERSVPVIWALTGLINIHTGTLSLIAPSIGETYNAEVVAVELNVQRVNANRRS